MAQDKDGFAQNSGLYVCMAIYLLILVGIACVAYRRKQRAVAENGNLNAHFGGALAGNIGACS